MQTRESVLNTVIQSVAQSFNCAESEVKEESNISNDFGADSLDMVALVMDLEKEFNIAIPDAEAEIHFTYNKTVKDIVDYLMTKINQDARIKRK